MRWMIIITLDNLVNAYKQNEALAAKNTACQG